MTWLNKQTRNYKNCNSYAAPSPNCEFQIDLMDVSSLLRDVGVEKGNQRKFDMVCIDLFGKNFHVVLPLALFMMPWWSDLRSWDSLWWFAAMTKEHCQSFNLRLNNHHRQDSGSHSAKTFCHHSLTKRAWSVLYHTVQFVICLSYTSRFSSLLSASAYFLWFKCLLAFF